MAGIQKKKLLCLLVLSSTEFMNKVLSLRGKKIVFLNIRYKAMTTNVLLDVYKFFFRKKSWNDDEKLFYYWYIEAIIQTDKKSWKQKWKRLAKTTDCEAFKMPQPNRYRRMTIPDTKWKFISLLKNFDR